MQKHFKTLEAAVDYLTTLRDSDVWEEKFETCQILPDENDRISEAVDIDDNIMPVCGHFSILTNKISKSQNSYEDCVSKYISNEQSKKHTRLCSSSRVKKLKPSTFGCRFYTQVKKSTVFNKPIKRKPTEKIADTLPELMEAESNDIIFKFM